MESGLFSMNDFAAIAPVGAGEDSEASTRIVDVAGVLSFSIVGDAEAVVGVGVCVLEMEVLEDVELALELVELEEEIVEAEVADEVILEVEKDETL